MMSETREDVTQLGLQAVWCRTREIDGKRSPLPMPGTTGSADFGVVVAPDKNHTRPAFRVPTNAILLDVDRKERGADGVASLLAAEIDLGLLPDTQRLTAHGFEQKTGRYCFRIPEGMKVDEQFFAQYGGAIDVIRTGHRFSMAPGDIHHYTGTCVECYGPDGAVEELLPVSEWPMLPVDWLLELGAWNDAKGMSGLDDAEDDVLDKILSRRDAKARVVGQLDKILTHDTSGSGFRAKLMAASVTLGGFVGTLYPDAERAIDALADAVGTLWGAQPDGDDMTMIVSGISKGAARPWVVLADEPESVRAETIDLPPVTLADAAQATTWLREEIGRHGLSGLFLRGGELVKVVEAPMEMGAKQHDGFQQIAAVRTSNQLRAYAQLWGYRFYTKGSKQTAPKPILLNAEAAAVCIDTAEGLPNIHTLRGVTGTPIIRVDGSILDTPGYDPGSGLLYKPDSDALKVPWVSAEPSPREVSEAREVLEYLVVDYKFTDDNQRANYLGSLMLPFLRALVPPPYKLLAIDASTPGSGKTLLADVLRIIHHGRHGAAPAGAFRADWPKREEFSKWVTSVLLNGAGGVVHVDNVKATLAGAELEGLLTNAAYGGRVLGRSETVDVPNDRLWVVTGNNVSIGGDMARRTLWVRIDPDEENPEQRTPDQFHEPDLAGWTFRHRGEIIHAVLTLARAWFVAGAVLSESTTSDSYSRAIGTVQGILTFAGISGTFDPIEDRVASQDEDDTEILLAALWEWQDEDAWTAAQLAQAINGDFGDEGLREAIPEFWWNGKGVITAQSLGKKLSGIKGRIRDGKVVRPVADGGHSKIKKWKVTTK